MQYLVNDNHYTNASYKIHTYIVMTTCYSLAINHCITVTVSIVIIRHRGIHSMTTPRAPTDLDMVVWSAVVRLGTICGIIPRWGPRVTSTVMVNQSC